MRHLEARLDPGLVAEQDQIQVERARGARKGPRAAVVRLDLPERVE
jgi:hypothetical protein